MGSVHEQADLFGQAAHGGGAVADLVDTIPPERWDGPGLGEWDLRALVGHTSRSLLTVEAYLQRPAEQEDLAPPRRTWRLGDASRRTPVEGSPSVAATPARLSALDRRRRSPRSSTASCPSASEPTTR